MSIQSIERSAKRALANMEPRAKRGMFALVERRTVSVMAHSYQRRAWSTFTPGIVSSVDRDGIAKEVRLAGGMTLKSRDWARITIDAQQRIADPEGIAAKLVDDFGLAVQFRSFDEAFAAIKAAAGLA